MRTRLSSSFTPLFRTVLPGVWIVGMGISVATLWLAPGAAPARWVPPALAVVWAGVGAVLLRHGRRLSDVWLDGDRLVVRGRDGERTVPLPAVVGVREWPFTNPRMAFLRLRAREGEEVEVAFVARWQALLPLRPHSDVERLRVHAASREARP